MDLGTLLGMLGGTAVVLAAIFLGGNFSSFVDVPSMFIVLGGGMMATLIRFDIGGVFGALMIGVKVTFGGASGNARELVDKISELAKIARREGLMGLESVEIKDEFLKKGIQLCVDGLALDFIKDSLTRERDQYIERLEEGGRFFKVLGDAAPAFGMIGTLVGLVQMLSNMEDPAAIGPAMAVALLTTLYGALISNLIAIPINEKLGAKLAVEQLNRSLIIEGIIHIHNKTNPDIMVDFLNAYLPESQRIVEQAA
ncbi:MAG: MotA/TolQ/ExbB proton channel family protein [Alphaproteobacteria bacterium]